MRQVMTPGPTPPIQAEDGGRAPSMRKPRWTRPAAIAAAIFGVATIVTGAGTLFGPEPTPGSVVLFVLWFNFLAGFAYLAGACALYRRLPWALGAAIAIAAATTLVALGFVVYTTAGGAFSWRTPGALLLRVGFWAAIAWGLWARSSAMRDA